ncbi:MAG: lipopolysaccharide heptosyltransferase II, partial [Calditrichaeota bacterium]
MKKTNNYNHILLVRTDRIGDVILTTPSISLLRENYPSARISFLTRNYTKPLLEHHRDLDNIIVYDPEQRHKGIRGLFKLAQDLKNQDIDLAILFHPLPALALALFMASIPHRAGTGYRW